MEDFTLIDLGAGFILLVSSILAYSRGFVREMLAILGWVVAAVAGFYFAQDVHPLLSEIPVLGDILGDSCELAIIAGFAVVFTAALVIMAIFTPLFAGAIQKSALSGFDQGLRFLFGAARGLLLILVALVAYTFVGTQVEMVEASKTKEFLAGAQTSIQQAIETDSQAGDESVTSWFTQKYNEMTETCVANRNSPNLPAVTGN